MNTRSIGSATAAALLLGACAIATAGCDVLGRISGAYRGPLPAQEGISAEVAIIRSLRSDPEGGLEFVMDRVRYLDGGQAHDVNRVVRVRTTSANQAQVSALNLAQGERVVISTTFGYIGDAAELTEVPDWPGHRFYEYPIGVHILVSIARTGP